MIDLKYFLRSNNLQVQFGLIYTYYFFGDEIQTAVSYPILHANFKNAFFYESF